MEEKDGLINPDGQKALLLLQEGVNAGEFAVTVYLEPELPADTPVDQLPQVVTLMNQIVNEFVLPRQVDDTVDAEIVVH